MLDSREWMLSRDGLLGPIGPPFLITLLRIMSKGGCLDFREFMLDSRDGMLSRDGLRGASPPFF